MTGWPQLDYAISWPSGPTASPSQQFWCSVKSRVEGKVSSRRGKQYELDQVQPGELTLTLRNDDGLFDPTNTASPYAGFIVPYRLIRVRAQLPATVNGLTSDQATAWYASKGAAGAGAALPAHVTAAGAGYPVSVVNAGSTNGYQVAIPASPAGLGAVSFDGVSVVPGGPVSAQALVSGSAGLQVQALLVFVGASGAALTTPVGSVVTLGSGQALVTVSATAPVNACGALVLFSQVNSLSTASQFTVSNVQVENAAAPSTWVQPGVWYSLFTGYVERWTQSWQRAGNYGQVQVTAVDAFSWLAAVALDYPAYSDLMALRPTFFYPLDGPNGVYSWPDRSGNRAPLTQVTANGGTVTAGAALQATNNTLPAGVPSSGVTFTSSGDLSTQNFYTTVGSALDLGSTHPQNRVDGTVGPPTSAAWTRTFGFRATSTAANRFLVWTATNRFVSQNAYQLYWQNLGNFPGWLEFDILRDGVAPIQLPLGFINDGNWHIVSITMNSTGTKVNCILDGNILGSTTTTTDMRPTIRGNTTEQVGGYVLTGSAPSAAYGFSGQMNFVSELPFEASFAQVLKLHTSYRTAWGTTSTANETSGGRYQRILNWINYPGAAACDTGQLLTYGPANDILGGANPTAALAALQAVVDSESGAHYVAADGTVTFQSRAARWDTTPAAYFGERPGEIPYTDAIIDFDPTRLANDINVQNQAGSAANARSARVIDPTSRTAYGTVTLQRTVNSVSNDDLLGTAQYLCYQTSQPAPRLQAVPINVGANPALWQLLLPLELGATVQLNRRPLNAPALALPGFVEQIQWDLDDQNAATCTVQLSSTAGHRFAALDDNAYGLLDSTAVLAY